MGDAIAPVDPDDPLVAGGFAFRGRVREDFKLSTGTWVRVGMLRARLLAELGDIALDVVVAGHGRERVAVLLFPNLPACRTLAGSACMPRHRSPTRGFGRPSPSAWRVTTRPTRAVRLPIFRALLLDSPPSLEAMEITDKGSINQRAVLARRQAEVEQLWDATTDDVLL